MSEDKQLLNALHDLVATCNDSAEGYAKAAKDVHSPGLSNWLAQESADRGRFVAKLNRAIRQMGEQPRLDLHEGEILHRGWVDLEQRLRSKDDAEIIRECIGGDSGTLRRCDHALAQDLNSELRLLLVEQRTDVEDALVYLQKKVSRQHGA